RGDAVQGRRCGERVVMNSGSTAAPNTSDIAPPSGTPHSTGSSWYVVQDQAAYGSPMNSLFWSLSDRLPRGFANDLSSPAFPVRWASDQLRRVCVTLT